MLQESQKYFGSDDSDETRFSGTWPQKDNDFDGGTQNIESDEEDSKPLAYSAYCVKKRSQSKAFNTDSALAITPTNDSFGNTYPQNVTVDSADPMVEELMKNVGTFTIVANLHESSSPGTFLRKLGERRDTAQLGEEVFQETRRDWQMYLSEKAVKQTDTKTSDILKCGEDKGTCRTPRATSSEFKNIFPDPLSNKNSRREATTSPFFRSKDTHRSPLARVNPVSPAARKHYECNNSPIRAKDSPTNHAKIKPEYGALDHKFSFKINSIVSSNHPFHSNAENNDANAVPNSEIENIGDIVSYFKKPILKSTIIPASKYFKIRKRWRKERKERKLLQAQVNGMGINSGVSTEPACNNSESIAKLITTPSIGPFMLCGVKNDTLPQIHTKLQKCEKCPCICPKRNVMLAQNNSDVKYLLSSSKPNLPPILKKKLLTLGNSSDSEDLNNVASSSLNNYHSDMSALVEVPTHTNSSVYKPITNFSSSSSVIGNPLVRHSFTSPILNSSCHKDFNTQNSQQFSHGSLYNFNFK